MKAEPKRADGMVKLGLKLCLSPPSRLDAMFLFGHELVSGYMFSCIQLMMLRQSSERRKKKTISDRKKPNEFLLILRVLERILAHHSFRIYNISIVCVLRARVF